MNVKPRSVSFSAAALGAAMMMCAATFGGDPDYTVTILVKEGDAIPGWGAAGIVNDVSVNDDGDWIVDVNLVGGPPGVNRVLIRNGEVWAAPGDPIEPDDTIGSVANALKHMNTQGDVAWRPGLDENHSGMYLNFTPLIIRNDISTAEGFAPETEYTGIFRGRVTNDERVIMMATVNEPGLGTVRALVWLEQDERGNIIEEVLAKRFDDAPGTEPGVQFGLFNSSSSDWTVNNSGHVIYSVPLLNAPAETNGAIYIDHNLIVRKGDPSPIPGSNYANIASSGTRLDLSNAGDYIFLSTLTDQPAGANTVLVKNNMFTDALDEIVAMQGDTAPDLDGERTIDHFGSGVQPFITDNGDAVWYARFSGDSATNQGLYVNDRLILQKGVTTIDGLLLDAVCGTTATSNGISESLMVSPNGRFIILRNRFANTERAALLIEFEEPKPVPCPGDLTGSGSVGVADLLELLACWGPVTAPACEAADLTGNDSVGVADLLDLLAQWGPCP